MRSRWLWFTLLFLVITPICEAENSSDTIPADFKTILPLNWLKICGYIFFILFMILAVIGGLGGGTFCVQILLIFFKFDVIHSSAISNTVITLSCLVQYLGFYLMEKHPHANAPITDYSIAILLLPMTLFGAKCGLLAYRIFSSSSLMLFLTLVLIVFSVLTIMKGVNFIKQNRAPLALTQAESRVVGSFGTLPSEEQMPEPVSIFPIGKFFYAMLMMVIILLADLLQGSKHTPSILSITSCSALFFIIFGIILIISALFTALSYNIVKQDGSHISLNLNWWGLTKVILVAFVSGFLLSSTGVGGGMTINPLLLQMGVLPEVAAATTVFVLIITTLTSSLLFITHGSLILSYFIILNIFSIIATIGTRLGVRWCCRDRFKMQAGIILSVGGLLVITAIIIPVTVFIKGATLESIFSFKDFCSN